MEMKEFFKLTIMKIIIFLLLIIPYNIQRICSSYDMIGAKQSCSIYFKFGIINLITDLGIFGDYNFALSLVYYILAILASYLLSCIIVSIFRRKH